MSERITKQPCQGWTSRREFRNNLPCGNAAQPGKMYCKVHDPDLREARETALLERFKAKQRERTLGEGDR